MSGTGYSDDALRVDSNTRPAEVREFVDRRARNPINVDGITIWNFSTHEIDWEALHERVSKLYRDEYIIPYQLGPVWGYMTCMLPKRIREAEFLRYDNSEGEYHPHKNFARVSSYHDDTVLRKGLAKWCANDLGPYLDSNTYRKDFHGDRDA